MNSDYKDRIKGALYAFAIGDSMGATTEFMTDVEISEKYDKITDIVGGGWLDLNPGECTDDTDMSICVMNSLMENDSVNFEKNTMKNFVDWYNTHPRDIGNQCRRAIEHYIQYEIFIEEDDTALGNGSLMRALPCALLDNETSEELNIKQGKLTHNNDMCDEILREYTQIIRDNINGKTHELEDKQLLKPSGYIVNTFNNAIHWAKEISIEDCIINAVNHGGDSDTIAAIAGSISGSIHGYSAIPKRWIEKLDENVKEQIEKFVEYLCDGNVNDDRNKI